MMKFSSNMINKIECTTIDAYDKCDFSRHLIACHSHILACFDVYTTA